MHVQCVVVEVAEVVLRSACSLRGQCQAEILLPWEANLHSPVHVLLKLKVQFLYINHAQLLKKIESNHSTTRVYVYPFLHSSVTTYSTNNYT